MKIRKNLVLIASIAFIFYLLIGLFYLILAFFSNKPSSLEKLKANEIEFAKMNFKNDRTKLENLKKTVSYSLFEKTTNKDSLGIYMLSAFNELDSLNK